MMWGGGGDDDDDLAGGGGDFRLLVLGRGRPVARRKRNEVAVGRLAGDRGFTLVASCDVNLHHKVFNFTSLGAVVHFFTYGPSVGAAFFAPDGPKVRYFYIWTVYWRCS